MAKRNSISLEDWLRNCGGFGPKHSLDRLRAGLDAGYLNEQDEWGMTALSLAVMSQWVDGVRELLKAGANIELRYYRTGETALYMAVVYLAADDKRDAIISTLVDAGANPDAGNHWGMTPRAWQSRRKGLEKRFDHIPEKPAQLPKYRIQNAEHLADHHHPHFEIPDREERESLKPGQAVDLHVYGPKTDGKQDRVKVRIKSRREEGVETRYIGTVESPPETVHLPIDVREVEFGPEHVATVYVPQPKK